jgi:Na+/H+-translocating membrane pyrophosphatase
MATTYAQTTVDGDVDVKITLGLWVFLFLGCALCATVSGMLLRMTYTDSIGKDYYAMAEGFAYTGIVVGSAIIVMMGAYTAYVFRGMFKYEDEAKPLHQKPLYQDDTQRPVFN